MKAQMTRYERAVALANKETHDERGVRNLTRHYFAFLLMRDSILPYSSIGKNRSGKLFRTRPVHPLPLP